MTRLSLFLIKFLVSIFKIHSINVFLNCKCIFNIFKNDYFVLCIVYTFFINVANLCNIFLIFYNFLNFCYFTIFGSIKFAVWKFYDQHSLFCQVSNLFKRYNSFHLRTFQIRLTLIISNKSNCENMIAFCSFILLFLLLPHKRDLWLKTCISTIFLFFSISHFPSKKSLNSFPENTLKNITTSEIFTY